MREDRALAGKRILFLSASFFGYQYLIKEQMEKMGAVVDMFDERPANTTFVKALIRINPRLIRRYIDRYHDEIIDTTSCNRYDYVFIVKAEAISQRSLRKLRTLQGEAKFVLYLWDSLSNFVEGPSKIALFDRVLTFDKSDAQQYGMVFRPLFYIPKYRFVTQGAKPQDIDILFVGTIHSDRYRFLREIAQQAQKTAKRTYFYMFFMSKLLYYKMKVEDKMFREVKKDQFKFTSLSQSDIMDLLGRSKTVIDIQHPKQTGLTMRTIETLAAERKLITTNAEIVDYDFYRPENILVVDRFNPVLPPDFIDTSYKKVEESVLEKYSLEYWVREVLLH